ncbi:MAG: hypothetical protein COA66_04220 [Arcobacter sp.]|nr:MAG: hypothetical protein COA66_04220 [Arcobacter sp.]
MEFKTTKKPINIDTNSRILYLTIIVLFIMNYTGSGKEKNISLLKIHLLLWAIQNPKRRKKLLKSVQNDCEISIGFWNIEIRNNSILTFLLKDDLCGFNGKKYFLTEDGLSFIKNIKNLEIMKDEQEFLICIGKKLTDKNVEKLKGLWS